MATVSPTRAQLKIIAKTGGRCHVCGELLDINKKTWEIDHVQPRAQHGSDAPENKLLICLRCNGLRGNKRPDAIRRILFLGVLANGRAYLRTSTASGLAADLRDLRSQRLMENWRTRQRASWKGSAKELRRAARKVKKGFDAFEGIILKRLKTRETSYKRWSKAADELVGLTAAEAGFAKSAEEFDAMKAAYLEFVRFEGPSVVERTTDA